MRKERFYSCTFELLLDRPPALLGIHLNGTPFISYGFCLAHLLYLLKALIGPNALGQDWIHAHVVLPGQEFLLY